MNPHVVLASASPRRRELLRNVVSEFEVDSADVDEALLPGETPQAASERLALEKARVVAARHPSATVIGSDTIVALEGPEGWRMLGKPESQTNARAMLRELSGKKHLVITGVAIVQGGREQAFSVPAWVSFRELTDAEIAGYVATGEPMDKAGAYAIQGGAAGFVTALDGPMDTVIGLPCEELSRRLGWAMRP